LGCMPWASRRWAGCAHRRTPGHSLDAKMVARASYAGVRHEPGRGRRPSRGSLRDRPPPGPWFPRGPAGSTPSMDSCQVQDKTHLRLGQGATNTRLRQSTLKGALDPRPDPTPPNIAASISEIWPIFLHAKYPSTTSLVCQRAWVAKVFAPQNSTFPGRFSQRLVPFT
jgi:hypothetical protein